MTRLPGFLQEEAVEALVRATSQTFPLGETWALGLSGQIGEIASIAFSALHPFPCAAAYQ